MSLGGASPIQKEGVVLVTRIRTAPMRLRGYSLIEALVVIAVLSILASIAIPSAVEWITNMRMTSQANDLVADILLARSEAGARGVSVTICPSTDATTCLGSNDWSNGRIVRVVNVGGTAQVLRVGSALSGASSLLSWDAASVPANSFGFGPYGNLVPLGGGATFRLCPDANSSVKQGRTISINTSGRPSVARVTCP